MCETKRPSEPLQRQAFVDALHSGFNEDVHRGSSKVPVIQGSRPQYKDWPSPNAQTGLLLEQEIFPQTREETLY